MPNHLLEPDFERVFGLCSHCGMEIYEGETYYDIEGEHIHEDCFSDYLHDLYADCKKEAGCYE